jgi:hypothetical protein
MTPRHTILSDKQEFQNTYIPSDMCSGTVKHPLLTGISKVTLTVYICPSMDLDRSTRRTTSF